MVKFGVHFGSENVIYLYFIGLFNIGLKRGPDKNIKEHYRKYCSQIN